MSGRFLAVYRKRRKSKVTFAFEKETWNMGFSIFAIGKNDEAKNYYPSDHSIEVIKNWYRPTNEFFM